MKRFYTTATVDPVDGGFGVLLDGRPVRTPGKRILAVPHLALADAIADEWRGQEDTVIPSTMGITRLANSAIDVVAERRLEVIDELTKYAETDLLCYRTGEPEDLAAFQNATWQPLLDWMAQNHNVRLEVTWSVMPVVQTVEAISAIQTLVATHEDFPLTGLHAATAATGSIVIGFGMAAGRLGPEAAFDASVLDETYQIDQWGDDPEAAKRRENLRRDIDDAARFLVLCGSE